MKSHFVASFIRVLKECNLTGLPLFYFYVRSLKIGARGNIHTSEELLIGWLFKITDGLYCAVEYKTRCTFEMEFSLNSSIFFFFITYNKILIPLFIILFRITVVTLQFCYIFSLLPPSLSLFYRCLSIPLHSSLLRSIDFRRNQYEPSPLPSHREMVWSDFYTG